MILRPPRFLARTLWHLAFLAMMLLVFAPGVGTSFWQCEGRGCGVTAWACCCAVPTDDHDPECGTSRFEAKAHLNSASHLKETTACVADCHCTMVVQDSGQSLSREAAHFVHSPALLVAILPRSTVLEVPTVRGTVQPLESRGPPPNAASLTFPSLRGPPLS